MRARPDPADWRRLLVANATSLAGSHVTDLALALIAVLELGATATEVGVLAACRTAAYLVVGLPVGAVVDRVDQRAALVIADLGRAAAVASIPVAAFLGVLGLTQLFVVAAVAGLLSVLGDVTQQTLVPRLVGRDALPVVNARFATVQSFVQVGGPGVGGLLIQLVGAAFAMVADALSFLVSAALVWQIRHRRAAPEPSARRSFLVEIRAGLTFVARSRPLRMITLASAWYNLVSGATGVVLILVLARELRLSAGLIGGIYSVAALGGVLGSLVVGRLVSRVGVGRTMTVGLVVAAAGGALVPTVGAGATLWLAAGGLLVGGVGLVTYNVAQVTWRQRTTPSDLLGRVNATVRLVVTGAVALGAAAGGLLAEMFGLRPVLWANAGALLLAVLLVATSPLGRGREIEPAADSAAVIRS